MIKHISYTEIILSLTCFLQTLQKGLLWAILPDLLKASEQASRYGLLIGIASAVGLIMSFFMGRASDLCGRLISYRIAVVLSSITPFLVTYGVIYNNTTIILFGTLFSRIQASRVLARAIAIDMFQGDKTLILARQGACSGIGFVIGPTLGGWLYTYFGTEIAVVVNLMVTCSNILLAWIVLRKEKKKQKEQKELKELKELKEVVVEKKKEVSMSVFLNEIIKYDSFLLLSVLFSLSFGFQAFTASFAMYCKSRFHFGPLEYGRVLSFCGIVWSSTNGCKKKKKKKR